MMTLDKSHRYVDHHCTRYYNPDLGAEACIRIMYDGGFQHLDVTISSRYLNTFPDGAYRWCTKWNQSDKYVFPDGTIEK
jgi:hypothetical protein